MSSATCGGLNISGGPSTVGEGGTPENATSRFAITGCTGTVCTLGPTLAAGPGFDCTNTGCNFGPPLPIRSAGTSTCAQNTWSAPASGTVDTASGTSSTSVPLKSHVFLTGNGTAPCPRCVSGSCERDADGPNGRCTGSATPFACCTGNSAGSATGQCAPKSCTTSDSMGTSTDCAIDGTDLGNLAVDLTPLVTSTAQKTDAAGFFCPGQATPTNPNFGSKAGCFGSAACTHIEEIGIPAGGLAPGVPTSTRLASVFCIPGDAGRLRAADQRRGQASRSGRDQPSGHRHARSVGRLAPPTAPPPRMLRASGAVVFRANARSARAPLRPTFAEPITLGMRRLLWTGTLLAVLVVPAVTSAAPCVTACKDEIAACQSTECSGLRKKPLRQCKKRCSKNLVHDCYADLTVCGATIARPKRAPSGGGSGGGSSSGGGGSSGGGW